MSDFAAFARAHGVLVDRPESDGRIRRVPTAEHPRSRNGAYRYTGDWGWVMAWDQHTEPVVWRAQANDSRVIARVRIDRTAALRIERERAAKAAGRAQAIVARCYLSKHPYLRVKGFPHEQGLCDTDGRLVVPMRSHRDLRRIQSVQWIDDSGAKRFLPGGAAKGAVYSIGAGAETWLCEGYATGLSVRAALERLYRNGRVLVCFSAGNLAHVAGEVTGPRYVVADNDASGTGQRAAEGTGLPWCMPDEVGLDANDVHRAYGLGALVDVLRDALR